MTDAKALLELAARCEAATGADRDLDCEIAIAVGAVDPRTKAIGLQGFGYVGRHQFVVSRVEQYTASLDTAMMLVPEGWHYAFSSNLIGPGNVAGLQRPDNYAATDATAATPALALCAASLRAIAQEQSK